LRDVDDIVKGAVEAVGDDVHDQLDIAVEEGDGTVARQLVVRLAQFVEETDDALEESSQRGGGGGVTEGRVEDVEEGRDEDVLVVPVELVRKAIVTRSRPAADCREGDLKVLLGEEAVTIKALGEFGIGRRKGAGDGGEESLLGRSGYGAGRKETGRRVRGVEGTGVIHGLADFFFGGEDDGIQGGAGLPAGSVEGGDDGGSSGDTSEGVEVVGRSVGEEMIEDGSRADGPTGKELPLVAGAVNCLTPSIEEGGGGGIDGGD